jgi:hypothetical protein
LLILRIGPHCLEVKGRSRPPRCLQPPVSLPADHVEPSGYDSRPRRISPLLATSPTAPPTPTLRPKASWRTRTPAEG